jgi:tRNA(Leu) C34 or U34 (ribose-2'-O)-methylase TrmL
MENSHFALIAIALSCIFCVQVSESALSISRAPLGLMRTLHTKGFGSEGEEMPANAIQQEEGLWISMPATRSQRSLEMNQRAYIPEEYTKRTLSSIFYPTYE